MNKEQYIKEAAIAAMQGMLTDPKLDVNYTYLDNDGNERSVKQNIVNNAYDIAEEMYAEHIKRFPDGEEAIKNGEDIALKYSKESELKAHSDHINDIYKRFDESLAPDYTLGKMSKGDFVGEVYFMAQKLLTKAGLLPSKDITNEQFIDFEKTLRDYVWACCQRAVKPTQNNDWIEWHGGECPVNGDTVVQVKRKDGKTETDNAIELLWMHYDLPSDITHYRIAGE